MNNATLVVQEEYVLAHQPVHHITTQNFLAIHPNHSFPTYRSVLEFNVVKLSSHRNHPSSYHVVFALIFLESLAVVRNCDVHFCLSFFAAATKNHFCAQDLINTIAHMGLLCPTFVAIVFQSKQFIS